MYKLLLGQVLISRACYRRNTSKIWQEDYHQMTLDDESIPDIVFITAKIARVTRSTY